MKSYTATCSEGNFFHGQPQGKSSFIDTQSTMRGWGIRPDPMVSHLGLWTRQTRNSNGYSLCDHAVRNKVVVHRLKSVTNLVKFSVAIVCKTQTRAHYALIQSFFYWPYIHSTRKFVQLRTHKWFCAPARESHCICFQSKLAWRTPCYLWRLRRAAHLLIS